MLLLCYFIVRVETILAVGSRHPEVDEFGTVFVFVFFISLSEAGLNDQFHGGRAIRVQFVQGGH